MHTIIGWIIASICIAIFIGFVGASLVAAVASVREPQVLDEARRDAPTTA